MHAEVCQLDRQTVPNVQRAFADFPVKPSAEIWKVENLQVDIEMGKGNLHREAESLNCQGDKMASVSGVRGNFIVFCWFGKRTRLAPSFLTLHSSLSTNPKSLACW